MGKVEELLIWPFCSCKAPGTITGVKGGELSLKGMADCGKKAETGEKEDVKLAQSGEEVFSTSVWVRVYS